MNNKLQKTLDYAENIVATVREPLVVLNGDLRVISANRSFNNVFKVTPEETEQQLLYYLGNRQWDIPNLRKLLEDILPHKNPVEDYEVEHLFETIGQKTMLINARKIINEKEELILLAIEDITEQKKTQQSLDESEKRFMNVLYASDDAILIIDNETFVDCNSSTVKMLKYTNKEKLLMTHPSKLSPPVQPDGRESFEKAEEMMKTALTNGYHRFEWVHRKADGEDFPVEVSLTPITLKGRTIIHCLWRDVSELSKAQEQLKVFKYFFKSSIQGFGLATLETKTVLVNDTLLKLLGIGSKEDFIGKSFMPYFTDEWKIKLKNEVIPTVLNEGSWSGELKHLTITEKVIVCHESFFLIRDKEGSPKYIASVVTDITERKKLEKKINKNQEKLEKTVEEKTHRLNERVKDINCLYEISQTENIPGITLNEIYEKTIRIMCLALQFPDLSCVRLTVNNKEYKTENFKELNLKSESPIIVNNSVIGAIEVHLIESLPSECEKTAFMDEELSLINAVADRIGRATEGINNAGDLKKANLKLERLVFIDALTGLINRKPFFELLEREVKKHNRANQKLALLFLDLENFKTINDIHGHEIGDKLLKKTAEIISSNIRSTDFAGRIGGDEFVVCLNNIKSIHGVCSIAEKINNAFSNILNIDAIGINLGVSIGISISPKDGDNAIGLLKSGDLAMYRAKKNRKNSYYLFDRYLEKTFFFEQALKNALDKTEFSVNFQPIVDKNGKIYSAEALLRWGNTELGHVMPSDFISLLEDDKSIIKVGEWVFREACKVLFIANNTGQTQICVSVNVSQYQLDDDFFVEKIDKIISETKVNPNNIVIEITEKTQIENIDKARKTITELKRIGIGSIALDDFGLGYSSFNRLYDFPLDIVKIDKFFVDRLNEEKYFIILESLISLLKKSDMKVIVEGVETKEQFEILKKMECDYFQGFYFSKPVPNILEVLERPNIKTSALECHF